MIVDGTRDVSKEAAAAPVVDVDDRAPLDLPGGHVLQVLSELTFAGFADRLPPALHPTHPPYVTMLFYKAPESEAGPFTMAQVRVSSIAGMGRFGYLVQGWIDNEEAGALLGRRFGYWLDPADVTLTRRHDRHWGTVCVAGKVVLEAGLRGPEPVSGADANHVSNLNLALVDQGRGPEPTLVQAGPQLTFRKCDRGKPEVRVFDPAAIARAEVTPYWHVSAFSGECDFHFDPVQFICDPSVRALESGLILGGTMHALR